MGRIRDGWVAACFLRTVAGASALEAATGVSVVKTTLVLDVRDSAPVRSDAQSLIAIQVCTGLMNRNESLAGAAYAIWDQCDLDWLEDIEGLSNPTFTTPGAFVRLCLDKVVNSRYILYNYDTQQEILPNLLTLSSVLEAVPLVKDQQPPNTTLQLIFDAEKHMEDFSPYDATSYVFDHYASQTTAMAKMNPGYEYTRKHSLHPPLTGFPHLQSADFMVKERLFTYFLPGGCIPLTRDHALMERMVQKNEPNTSHWDQPIIVYGYDDNDFGVGVGDPFEAETNCVKEHNLGQISTHFVPNLSYWARKPAIKEPMIQNPVPTPGDYNSAKTYIALVIGDGDSFNKLRGRNSIWVKQRVSYCNNSSQGSCFPLSWTMNQHAAHIAPDLLKWYYAQARVTGQDYFLLPPSGHLYAYPAIMQEEDQEAFVTKTEEGAHLLNTTGTVDWEFSLTWKGAIHEYLPKLANKNVIKGVFAVNVPFNIPVFSFGLKEYYKIIQGGQERMVLFRPREWRGASGHTDIPFGRKSYLTEKDMAEEINNYPAGTVSYIYVTSDGGATLDNIYKMVSFLGNHVEVVNHEIAARMALQRSAKLREEEGDIHYKD